ncbi:MAG: UDP-N-acetylmuramoyl-L-alanine--D-glutamate ligase [Leptospiraceae bacterium]|nr:UDP-N-acetylmuramoyl-L-alanine--D-glutamate ligase [Leptospiraceae bacterium]MDW8306593.1 UDP-N-acetylmuramoyl-L-alanine--D-glutamate ligase [Leptospiraceae bacterium]
MELGQRVLFVGAKGKTGQAFSRLLLSLGYEVLAYDQNERAPYPPDLLQNNSFFVVLEEQLNLAKLSPDWLTLSPGVPLSLPIFREAQEKKIPVVSELEFTAPTVQQRFSLIGITGTDGKSTTTALLAHLLNFFSVKSLACANFGLPFSAILNEIEKYEEVRYLVAELSSFMLEKCQGLSLKQALYLNISPNHLDRYASMADYCLAKWNIYHALEEKGIFIVNQNLMPERESYLKERHPLLHPQGDKKIIEIDPDHLESRNFSWLEAWLYSKTSHSPICHESELRLRGRHNKLNILFALEALHNVLGPIGSEKLRQALKEFIPLAHRFEILPSRSGNIYINDSKATTTQATLNALANVSDPVFLFLGGRSKGENYQVLADYLLHRDIICFLYGEEKNNLAKIFQERGISFYLAPDLSNAFWLATACQKEKQQEKITYLLSPAMASWDQFANYEERGNLFKQLVAEYESSYRT